jgi:hypothetical protein
MCVNAKMMPVETVPGIRGGRLNESSGRGWNSSMIYLIYCTNIYKGYKVPPPSTTIIK